MSGDDPQPVPGPALSPALRARPCPICGKPAVDPHRPFCSKRCADVDLNRWLSGSYTIPVVEEDGGNASGEGSGD